MAPTYPGGCGRLCGRKAGDTVCWLAVQVWLLGFQKGDLGWSAGVLAEALSKLRRR